MISNHVKVININDNEYAIFNNLKLDILVVNEEYKDLILNGKIKDKSDIKLLKNYLIYDDYEQKYIELLNNNYENNCNILNILYLIVTDNCNLRCNYCFLENNPNCPKVRKTMSEDIARTAIDKFVKHLKSNNQKDGKIMIYGGEPLINYDVVRFIVDYCVNIDFDFEINIITNGTILTTEMAEFFSSHNVGVSISIDGPKDINDKNRKFRNKLESVYDSVINAKLILDNNKVEYGTSLVISEFFIENKEMVLDWIQNNLSNSIFYNLMHFDKYEEKCEKLIEDTANFMIESYEKLTQKDGRIQRQINSFSTKDFYYTDCGAVGFRQLTVSPNGDLCVCHGDMSDPKHKIGNILTDDIENLKYKKECISWTKRNTLKNKECLNCEAIFICGGGCRNHSEILYGNRELIDKTYCKYIKIIFNWLLKKTCSFYDNNGKGGEIYEKSKQ